MSEDSRQAGQVTRVLQAASAGDAQAARELLPLVYAELRSLAEARLRRTPPGQTLQATALVHEAYLRLVGAGDGGWLNRGHFFFAAARAIQDILVENARSKGAIKRGGDRRRVDLEKLRVADEAPDEELLALAEVLTQYEQEDAQGHRLVMLRFFAGLSEAEAAEALGMSERTVRREWRYARARLHQLLESSPPEPGDG
ncbi:MAG: ECF-type sigma factor [Phycisphaerae bacterium]